MAAICGNSLHICFIRVTRLNADGTVADAPNNHVVSDSPMMLTNAPEILAGEQKNLIGGCDCVNASYRGKDKLLHWNLTLQVAELSPALLEMLIGGGLQVDGGGDPIGMDWPSQVICSDDQQPPVALEAWSDLWVGDAPSADAGPYIRWVWPMAFFQLSSMNLENEFLLPQVEGYSRTNSNFGDAYGDLPAGVVPSPTGGFFYDSTVPTAVCGYSSSST